MKIYVKDMSGHKFAERGGGVLQICVFMTDIHRIGLKIGLKRHKFVSLSPIFLCICVLRNAPLSATGQFLSYNTRKIDISLEANGCRIFGFGPI
jgi:hypothetical protein